MAEADAQLKPEGQNASEPIKHQRKWLRLLVMVSVPMLLLIGGVAYYLANDHYVSTDNAYVQQDKVSVAAEIGGRIVEVGVKENQHRPGTI
jgi:membrane fusion protein, multidrug efflux system